MFQADLQGGGPELHPGLSASDPTHHHHHQKASLSPAQRSNCTARATQTKSKRLFTRRGNRSFTQQRASVFLPFWFPLLVLRSSSFLFAPLWKKHDCGWNALIRIWAAFIIFFSPFFLFANPCVSVVVGIDFGCQIGSFLSRAVIDI